MKQSTVVCALIHQQFDGVTKILVTKRNRNMDFLPGAYEIPGGHAEVGETHSEALIREIREELQLEIRPEALCDSFEYQTKTEKVTEYVYFAVPLSPIENIQVKPDEVEEYQWITANEVDTVVRSSKRPDDPEVLILHKAFSLL